MFLIFKNNYLLTTKKKTNKKIFAILHLQLKNILIILFLKNV